MCAWVPGEIPGCFRELLWGSGRRPGLSGPPQPQSSPAEKSLLLESGFDLFASIIGNLFITKLTTLHYLEEVSQEEKNSKKSPIHRFSDLPNFLGVKVHQEKLANLFSHT